MPFNRQSSILHSLVKTDKRCIIPKKILTLQIIQMTKQSVTEFLTGMAEGTDTWAAMIVNKQRPYYISKICQFYHQYILDINQN